MALTCVVKIDEEDFKEYLTEFYDEEEIEDMTRFRLQSEATEAVSAALNDHFCAMVYDKDSFFVNFDNDEDKAEIEL